MIAPMRVDPADRYRLATMASPTGIFLVDAEGHVSFVNPRVCEILDASAHELLGHGFLHQLRPEDRAGALQRIADLLESGEDGSADYRLQRPGDESWIRVFLSATHAEDGSITGLAGVCEDITARRREEQQGRALEAKLQQTHKLESLGLMAGGIAHDFNNLLVGIMGNAAIAQMDVPEGSEAAQALHDLTLAAERATELTTQLLAYAGRGRITEQAVDLNAVIEETVTMLRSSLPAQARLTLSLGEGVEHARGDATRLGQVAMNLLTNAADALPDGAGEIVVRTSMQHVDARRRAALVVDGGLAEGRHLVLEVRDTGCGMSPETLARIFDPFFTTKKKGRGLGLAATVGTIRAHKAGLEVLTAPDAGTTFRMILPSAPAVAPAVTPAAKLTPVNGTGTILVVDDDSAVRDVTRRLLSRQGFDVLDAADGARGVELLSEAHDRIRCVLLDLTMPGMDGAETFRRMRAVDPSVRVVVTSGHSERTLAAQFDGMGVAGYLHKPFDLTTLLRTTKAAMDGAA